MTASRASRVMARMSIMARSAAENAGTWEYTHSGRSRPSSAAMFRDQRLQPAFRMHSPQRMILGTVLVTDGRRQPHQIGKLRFIVRVQNPLFRPHAENNFLATLKISRIMRNPSLGEFQTMQPERNQRGREHHDLACGRMARIRAIDSAKRSCAMPSSTACTSRVARLP